jgi:hypothetical protein
MNSSRRSNPISLGFNGPITAKKKSGTEIELVLLIRELACRFDRGNGRANHRAYPRKRAPIIVRRLKLLLKALEVIQVCGSPAEKMIISLIGECLRQLYPERRLPQIAPSANSANHRIQTYL